MTTITAPPNNTGHIVAWARTLQLDLGNQIQEQQTILQLLTNGVNDVSDRITALRASGNLTPEQEQKINEIEIQNQQDRTAIENSTIYKSISSAKENLEELANI